MFDPAVQVREEGVLAALLKRSFRLDFPLLFACLFVMSSGLGVAFLLLGEFWFPGFDSSKNAVVVDPEVIDLGELYETEKYLSFQVMNRGSRPVQLEKVLASCGCTKVNLPRVVVAPGDSVAGNLSWSLLGLDGIVEKQFAVNWTEHESAKDAEIVAEPAVGVLRATVLPVWRLMPSSVVIKRSECEGLDAITRTIRVEAARAGQEVLPKAAMFAIPRFRDVGIAIEGSEVVLSFDRKHLVTNLDTYLSVNSDCAVRSHGSVQVRVVD